MKGIWQKILHVDLSTRKTWTESPEKDLYQKLIGGRALIAHLLLAYTEGNFEPLGPENILVFSAGVFQGTSLPGCGRHAVGAKSPLTGMIGSSEVGGYWGTEFKRCGYDALVVHGRADAPVYLLVRDDKVEIREAVKLWGKETGDVETLIRQETGDEKVRVAQCGIAGENQVRFASIMHDVTRAAGRNGLGAVMGSKNLKAVAVRGTKKPDIADRDRFMKLVKWMGGNYKDLTGWLADSGTSGGMTGMNSIGALPTKNFEEPQFGGIEKISGQLMKRTLITEQHTCHACPVKCKQIVNYQAGTTFPDEPLMSDQAPKDFDINPLYGGPEYETIGAFGSACLVDDLLSVAKANELAARYGVDTISSGMTLAFVMECMEEGLIDEEKLDGFAPVWGDGEALVRGIEMIAKREGFGDMMAEGSFRLARSLGPEAEACLATVKGQEIALHDPRSKFGHGLGNAVCPVGADHMINIHDGGYASEAGLGELKQFYDAKPSESDDLGPEKVSIFFHEVNRQHFYDCAVLCMFFPYSYEQLAEGLSAVTGEEYAPRDILKIGERAQQLSRLFNIRQGLTKADDQLPKKVMKAFKKGPQKDREITREALSSAVVDWYGRMGWSDDGVPGKSRLEELGLKTFL